MNTKFLNRKQFEKNLKKSIYEINDCIGDKSNNILFNNRNITSSLVQRYAFFDSFDIHNRIIKPIILDSSNKVRDDIWRFWRYMS